MHRRYEIQIPYWMIILNPLLFCRRDVLHLVGVKMRVASRLTILTRG